MRRSAPGRLGPPGENPPRARVGISARAGDELGLAHRHGFGALWHERGDKGLAVAFAPGQRRRFVTQVAVAPLPQPDQGDVEVQALLGQLVVVAIGPAAVWHSLEDPLVDELVEPGRQDVAGDPKALLELIETAKAQERISDDQQGPAFADDLERAGNRAVLPLIVAVQHPHNGTGRARDAVAARRCPPLSWEI